MADSHTTKRVIQPSTTVPKHLPEDNNSRELWEKSHNGEKLRGRIFRADLNLDTHPVVTRLQNEQNQRLEGMEQRMKKIRKSAQQEAERRKFAHLFRAKAEDKSQTERLLREASLALQRIKHEKQLRKDSEKKCVSDSCEVNASGVDSLPTDWQHQQTDKGDIIPVHVVPDKTATSPEIAQPKQLPTKVQQPLMWLLQPVETFQLDGVVLWLVLPFLLPVLLLLHAIRHFSSHTDSRSRKKN